MIVELPGRLYSAFIDETQRAACAWRDVPAHAMVDRRLLSRMEEAVNAGLECIQLGATDDVALHHESAQRSEAPSASPEAIVLAATVAHPEATRLRWLVVGYSVPRCPNDACAELFDPLVRADASVVVWHVAASLFTRFQCGVDTQPMLAAQLRAWSGYGIEAWCRGYAGPDPYLSFMARHAVGVLDDRVDANDRRFHDAYESFVGP